MYSIENARVKDPGARANERELERGEGKNRTRTLDRVQLPPRQQQLLPSHGYGYDNHYYYYHSRGKKMQERCKRKTNYRAH